MKQNIQEFDVLTLEVQGVIQDHNFQKLQGVSKVTVTADASNLSVVRIHVQDGATIIRRVLDAVEGQGAKVLRFGFHEPTLDDVFIQKTGRRIADEAKV